MNMLPSGNEQSNGGASEAPRRKSPVRSGYLFPAYDFAKALGIAEEVERAGAGRLEEETLAINLGQSVKSSSFKLRVLSAKQFGLLSKQGDYLITTPTAKAILKPMGEFERAEGMLTAFLTIPLFKAVADRFKGQPLPQGASFSNILEREFKIEPSRVQDAERKLRDSARDAEAIKVVGDKTYLLTEIHRVPHSDEWAAESNQVPSAHSEHSWQLSEEYETPRQPNNTSPSGVPGSLLTITSEDFAEIDDGDFQEVWGALGKVIQARAKKLRRQEYPPASTVDSRQLAFMDDPDDENQ